MRALGRSGAPILAVAFSRNTARSGYNYRLHKGFLQRRLTTMLGAFLGELGHLPFDNAWVHPIASWLRSLLRQFRQQRTIPLLQTRRRRAVALRQARLQGVQTAGERQLIDVQVLFL